MEEPAAPTTTATTTTAPTTTSTALCVIAWKLRSGVLGRLLQFSYNKGGSNKTASPWEQRVVAVNGSRLEYYEIGEKHMAGVVRGSLDIVQNQVQVQVASVLTPDAPTPHEVDISFVPSSSSGSTAAESRAVGKKEKDGTAETVAVVAPPPPSAKPTTTESSKQQNQSKQQHWKFCFEQQDDLMEFLQVVHSALEEHDQFTQLDITRFEHDFHAGDHIFRWEMIVCPPVIYPIQIHGIVLDAGRNCVVVADFGLTGYSRKQGSDFNHVDDHKHSNAVLTAWRKLRPHQDQRLNITAITDPHELRKWYRARYDEGGLAASKNSHYHLEKMSAFMTKISATGQKLRNRQKQRRKQQQQQKEEGDSSNHSGGDGDGDLMTEASARSNTGNTNNNTNRVAAFMSKLKISLSSEMMDDDGMDGNNDNDREPTEHSLDIDASATTDITNLQQAPQIETVVPMPIPMTDDSAKILSQIDDLNNNTTIPLEDATTTTTSSSTTNDPQQQQQQQQPNKTFKKASEELPKSDPTELVLARANYVLEHEDVLPPYHIFYSNSECIAVWCKTGRWSTLQTAVFLASNSVGGAKSATLATIGVAAAHALLAPVVALGGAIYVCAPMVMLKKSQEKWEQNTQFMTDCFWQWAPPAIYIAAIEHWSGLLAGSSDGGVDGGDDGNTTTEGATVDETTEEPNELDTTTLKGDDEEQAPVSSTENNEQDDTKANDGNAPILTSV